MFSPGHLGPTQTPVQPKEQGLPGVSAGGGGGGGATSCLAVIHSVILGMMGPLERDKAKEHEGCVNCEVWSLYVYLIQSSHLESFPLQSLKRTHFLSSVLLCSKWVKAAQPWVA